MDKQSSEKKISEKCKCIYTFLVVLVCKILEHMEVEECYSYEVNFFGSFSVGCRMKYDQVGWRGSRNFSLGGPKYN